MGFDTIEINLVFFCLFKPFPNMVLIYNLDYEFDFVAVTLSLWNVWFVSSGLVGLVSYVC